MAQKNPFIFSAGPIAPQFIADSIAKHQSKTNIGAHAIFLGQVRADVIDEKTVRAIEYTAYEDGVAAQMPAIREALFAEFGLVCLHIHHSLGAVPAGEICLFVFASARHRKTAFDACEAAVERIKKELPIWGKELFAGESYQWKTNT